MKRVIYPLFAPADESKVLPILDALQKKGVSVRSRKAAAAKRDVLLLFLSQALTADSPEADEFFRLNAGRELVIPVNLDGSAPPEELQNALMARHAIFAQRYATEELSLRIKEAVPETKPLPLILSLAAALLLLAVGIFLFWQRPAPPPPPPATEVPATPVPTKPPHVDGIETDLSLVAEVVYVGDVFKYYQMFDGYYMSGARPDNARGYSEVAYDVWDDGGPTFYSTEDGRQIPLSELGDVSYLGYLPNLMYLTFVNVKGELPDLSALRELRRVTVVNCEFPDLEGLRGSGVRSFEYHGRTVTDFSPLSDCAELSHVSVSPWGEPANADMSGFHPPKLEALHLDGSVDDLGGLQSCSRLKTLFLGNARVTDLSFLDGLKLLELRLDNLNRLTDLAGLQGMTTLEYLNITNCAQLAGLEGLQGMSALKGLSIDNCFRLKDISAVEGCVSLNDVHIGGDNGWMEYLTDVSVLGRLPKLRSIGLYGVGIRDLGFLQELKIKTGVNLGFCIERGADYSGLSAVNTYGYLHVNTGGNYAAAAPYLQDKSIRQLMIFDGGLVDLSTLPNVTSELDLCRCLNRDLTGIPKMGFSGKLWIQDCPYFTSFNGIENLTGIGKTGSILTVENCPRLSDWSGIEGKTFHRLEIERVLTLPDFSAVAFQELTLEKLSEDVLPDLSCLSGIDDGQSYSFHLEDLPQIKDLSPLFRLHGTRLEVPPQVGEQARGLVDDGHFKECEIVYPDGGWDPSEVEVRLLSLDELDTLPPSVLKHVKRLTLIGDELVNDDATDFWSDWSERNVPAFIEDRATGEQKRIDKPGTWFTDFSKLSALTGLEDLNLWWQPLTDLEGIQALENLQWLKVEFCPNLTDVSAAFTLQGLKEINFERCPVASLQGVQSLYGLERLEICNTKITSLEGIEGLNRLCQVRVAGDDITDFSPLSAVDFSYAMEQEWMPGASFALNVMNAGQLPQDALAFLENVPGFGCLELHDVPARLWVEKLAGKPVLELRADNCGITDEQLEAFAEAHPMLEQLDLRWNPQLTDLSCLLRLEKLREVYVSRDMDAAVASLGEGGGFRLNVE